MLNNINLIGRWTKDTEIVMSNNGTEILNGSLAVSDPYKKDHTDFIEVKAFSKLALNTNNFTKKGSKVAVVGKLNHERWETQDGQKRSKHVVIANQIVFLDDKSQSNQSGQKPPQNDSQNNAFEQNGEPLDISDQDLPF